MSTVTSGGHPALVRPFQPATRRWAPGAWLARIPLRRILGEAALVLALLSLVVAVIAARFVFHADGAFAPPVAAPVAVGATVVAVLAFVASALARDR